MQSRQGVGIFRRVRREPGRLPVAAVQQLRIVHQRHVLQEVCSRPSPQSPVHGIGRQQTVCVWSERYFVHRIERRCIIV